MNIKKTIDSIQQGKFNLAVNFLILFLICNLALHIIGLFWLESSNFLVFEKIIFPFYFLFCLYFSFITTLGAWRSGNYYVNKNKNVKLRKFLSILSKIIIIYWGIRIVNTFMVFVALFHLKFK
jgi:hypothetical protein